MTLLDDSHLTDPGLVAEVHMGRREAFGELYRRYYSGALRYALGMTRGDETRAQDIVSEAFTRVFRAVSRNGNISAFWPYLLASVRNAHRAELRRSGRVDLVERAADLDGLLPEAPSESGHDDPSVRAAFHRLPPRWQTVLYRSEICGDTAAEIGHDLGISANAAAALAFRAREGLRVEYLRSHLTHARTDCRPYAEQLAKLVRGVLGRRDRRRVEAHVRVCDECGQALTDLTALNGRMRSVLPLALGVVPFVSGQGISSAPVGAVGSGLFGSAGVVSGVAGTAGLTGGTTGAAGLVGLGGLGAVGMTHVTAVAGLAVASVVAVLGLPAERSSGEPADSRSAVTTVVPADAATTDESSGPLVEPTVDLSGPALSADEPAGDGALNAPSSVAAPSGEAGTLSGDVPVLAETGVIGGSDLAESVPNTDPASDFADGSEAQGPESADGSTDKPGHNGGGPESSGGQPFGDGVPSAPQGTGGNNWPWTDDEASGPGRNDVIPGTNGSADPASGYVPRHGAPAYTGHNSAPPSGSGKPEQAVEPSRKGPARPEQAVEPTREGPARPALPDQFVERTSPAPDLSGQPAGAAKSTSPARTSRHRRGTPVRAKGRHRRA